MNKICLTVVVTVLLTLPVINYAHAEVVPYQISLINPLQSSKSIHSVKGVRINIVYGKNEDVSGVDFGLFNDVYGDQKGLQFGLWNKSFKSQGVQIGIVNYTEYLNGLQIGFLNIHNMGDSFRVLPIVNFSF